MDKAKAEEALVLPRTAEKAFPNIDENNVMRKVDMHVVPILCLLYLLAFLYR
jgi:hypothetical protein